MSNPVPVPETRVQTPEEQSSAEKAMQQVRELEQQRTERVGAGIGQPGQLNTGGPPMLQDDKTQAAQAQAQKAQRQAQQAQQDDAQAAALFDQLTSVGYKPTGKALKNAVSQAYSGSVILSKTWLAHLFVKLLKSNKE